MKLDMLEMKLDPVFNGVQDYLRVCSSLEYNSDPDYDKLEECLNPNINVNIVNDLFEDAYSLFRAQLTERVLAQATKGHAEEWARHERAMAIIKRVDQQLNKQKIGAWFEIWREQALRKSLGVAA